MDIAHCQLDGRNYHIEEFADLPSSSLYEKRRHLICTECGWKAYFKRAAVSGQGACFGARPHSPNCSLAVPISERGLGGRETRDILLNPMGHIVIDTAYGAHETLHTDEGDDGSGATRGGRFTGDGPRGPARMNRRLRPLLKSLISSENFRNSATWVELPGHTTLPVNRFFVSFEEIGPEHENTFHGYWGLIYDTGKYNDGPFWLNTGKYDELSIMVPDNLYTDFKRRADIQFGHELEGMHVLVLGRLKTAMSGKQYIELEDLGMCALCDD